MLCWCERVLATAEWQRLAHRIAGCTSGTETAGICWRSWRATRAQSTACPGIPPIPSCWPLPQMTRLSASGSPPWPSTTISPPASGWPPAPCSRVAAPPQLLLNQQSWLGQLPVQPKQQGSKKLATQMPVNQRNVATSLCPGMKELVWAVNGSKRMSPAEELQQRVSVVRTENMSG